MNRTAVILQKSMRTKSSLLGRGGNNEGAVLGQVIMGKVIEKIVTRKSLIDKYVKCILVSLSINSCMRKI